MKAFLFHLLVSVSVLPAAEKPNILWITTEDIGPQIGCYGDTFAQTPHLDAFATRGQLFLHAWSNAPVCAPARTTIISGMYPTSTGSEHMRSMVPLPDGCQMYPQLLREAGWYCTNNNKEDYNLAKPGEVWDDSSKKAHWRNRKPGQPFFAIFNFTTTHESQIRKPGHKLKLDPAKVPLPAYHPDTPEVRRDWTQYYDNITTMDGQFQEKLDELKAAGLEEDTIVFFYGDHGAGMPRSKRWPYNSGLRVPLIVHFPKKWQHLAPAGYAPGAQSAELVSFVDLAPTLLSLVGKKAPAYMQGRAFCGTEVKPAPEFLHGFRGRMDERYDLVRTVTEGRHVYIRNYMPHLPYAQRLSYLDQMPTSMAWRSLSEAGKLNEDQSHYWKPKPTEELYDLVNDPSEVHNLASDPHHEEVLIKLRAAQQDHAARIRDLGYIPEGERWRISGGRSPRDAFATEAAYPFAEVAELASLASDRAERDAVDYLAPLKHPNAIMRYWASLGLYIREADAVKTGHEGLVQCLQDESPSVRIVAATALCQYGPPADLSAGLAVLLSAADPSKNNCFTALEALNAINSLGAKAQPIKAELATLPTNVPTMDKRLQEYVPRLMETTLKGQE